MIDLSVHLITYNNENHIEETLNSIFNQNCSFNFEIVVGDDCSTDNTLEIINVYSTNYPKVFNVKKNSTQLGILKNFKTTLDRCRGKYIFDIAGDDILKDANALQKIMGIFNKNPDLGFVDSGYDKLIVNKNKLIPFINKQSIIAKKDKYKEFIFLGKVIPIGICYNKKALYKYVNFDFYIKENITIEDYPILVNLVKNCDFETINESLHLYRIHYDSYSQKNNFERGYFLRNQMLKLFNHFKTKYHFSKKTNNKFLETHYKSLLFLAGNYEKKDIGKKAFKAIKNKNIKDVIHYLASQHPAVRSIIRLRKNYLKYLKSLI